MIAHTLPADATGPDALKVLDTDGESPLHLAARGNHMDIVKFLLEVSSFLFDRLEQGRREMCRASPSLVH